MAIDPQERRRKVRRTAITLAVIALAFYVGFILLTIHRSR